MLETGDPTKGIVWLMMGLGGEGGVVCHWLGKAFFKLQSMVGQEKCILNVIIVSLRHCCCAHDVEGCSQFTRVNSSMQSHQLVPFKSSYEISIRALCRLWGTKLGSSSCCRFHFYITPHLHSGMSLGRLNKWDKVGFSITTSYTTSQAHKH